MAEAWTGVIGIGGVLVGLIANELLRRTRRIEAYTARVFDVRLAKYEELMGLLHAASEVASDVMENSDYSAEERHGLISAAIFLIAEFSDKNELYIDSDLAAHCVATFMGAEDIRDIENVDEQNEAKDVIRDMYKLARQMIREASGVAEIDKLFKKITKPNLSGPIIERIRYLREHPEEVRPSRDRSH